MSAVLFRRGAGNDSRPQADGLPRWPRRQDATAATADSACTAATAEIALLGTGTVGRALLARLARLAPTHAGVRALRLVHVGNTRQAFTAPQGGAIDPGATQAALCAGSRARLRDVRFGSPAPGRRRIVIDATGSDAIAARHAGWLAAGIDVVTASKLGIGAGLARWHAIAAAQARAVSAHGADGGRGVRYGDSATVGAGLPILRTLRELRAGGDRVRAIAGVLSGSMAWLLAQHDGRRPFSSLVAEARARGYTEPDPRQDLSGEDVRRKLLILARSAGDALDAGDVAVESLADADDAALAARLQAGRVLRYVARWKPGRARIALEALAPDDPLAQGEGCDNRIALHTDRYRDRPLVLQGPGAGADVTAAALLDDVLAIVRGQSNPS